MSQILKIMGWLKIRKLEFLENETQFFCKVKKILNLCLRWHILRSYCFVAEVTFNMIWLMEILRIYLEEQLRIKYGVIKYKIVKIQNMDISVDLLHWLILFVIKRVPLVLLHAHIQRTQQHKINLVFKMKSCQTNNWLKNHSSQLLENLKFDKCALIF